MSTDLRRDEVLRRLRTGESAVAIALGLGVRKRWVRKVAEDAGIVLPKDRPGPRPIDTMPIKRKPLHEQIGRALAEYRRVDHDVTSRQVATRLGMSIPAYNKAEIGLHDFTLDQLIAISDLLQIGLPELVTPKVSRFVNPYSRGASSG